VQKIVSKYGLAAHLAFLTVAPLVLLPFRGADATATALLWLSAFGLAWILMEPSRRQGELSSDAKLRVTKAVLRDPLFWFSMLLVVYTGVMTLNTGIGIAYDAEQLQWFVKGPFVTCAPGCVERDGYFLFSVVVALSVVFQGLRHSVGRAARAAFVLVSSVGSASASCVLLVMSTYGVSGVLSLMPVSSLSATYFGTVFGLQLLCGLVALAKAIENEWMRAEPIAALAVVGNAVGLVLFAPLHTVAVFVIAYGILASVALFLLRNRCSRYASFRFFLVFLLSIVASGLCLFVMVDMAAVAAKIAAIKSVAVFPDGFFATREALSTIALASWKENLWLGTGLGSFPYDIRFMAAASDWAVISPTQKTALSGWWQLLVEHGVIGCALLAVTVGMLLFTYFSGLVRSWTRVRFSTEHLVGPLSLLSLVAISFVDCSFWRPEVLMLAGALFALSDGAFPVGAVTSKV